jgi:rod shape determining protein RodA
MAAASSRPYGDRHPLAWLASKIEWRVLLPAIALCLIGLLAISSAAHRSGADGGWTHATFPMRQAIWIMAGLVAGTAAALVHYKKIGDHAPLLWIGIVIALLLVLLIAPKVNGSRRWFDLGPLKLQPSEFAKLAVIVMLARALRAGDRFGWGRALGLLALLTAVPAGLIFVEPDLGTSLVFVPIAGAIGLAAGLPWRAFGFAFLVACLIGVPGYLFGLKDYQRARVRAFLGQGDLKQHQKVGEAYQVIQGKIAVGSGGKFGRGSMQGTQTHLRFLPFPHTDFVFAVVAEESGLAGSCLLLLMFSLLAMGGASVAARCRDPEGRMIAAGATTLLLTHAGVNLGMVVGLAPVTGLPLPFVSYGGSAMVSAAIAVGLICNVGARTDANGFVN